jgi:hypothetical protein
LRHAVPLCEDVGDSRDATKRLLRKTAAGSWFQFVEKGGKLEEAMALLKKQEALCLELAKRTVCR